MFEFMLTT